MEVRYRTTLVRVGSQVPTVQGNKKFILKTEYLKFLHRNCDTDGKHEPTRTRRRKDNLEEEGGEGGRQLISHPGLGPEVAHGYGHGDGHQPADSDHRAQPFLGTYRYQWTGQI